MGRLTTDVASLAELLHETAESVTARSRPSHDNTELVFVLSQGHIEVLHHVARGAAGVLSHREHSAAARTPVVVDEIPERKERLALRRPSVAIQVGRS